MKMHVRGSGVRGLVLSEEKRGGELRWRRKFLRYRRNFFLKFLIIRVIRDFFFISIAHYDEG